MNELKSFRDLKCWKEAIEFRKHARLLMNTFPADEKYRLTDQLVRALRSVTNNIAEGFGRFHYQENIQFCRHSRGSLTEIQDHFYCAFEKSYISQEEMEDIFQRAEKVISLINGYINYLKKAKDRDNG
ncbi:MAG: four helix bundle protein [Spirosomataceae bacterium]